MSGKRVDNKVVDSKVTEKSPLERANEIINVWLHGKIVHSGETHIAVESLKRLGAFYSAVLSRLDHTKSDLLPSNRAMALVANRGLKCMRVEAACYYKDDNTRYEVVLSEESMPAQGHNYAGGRTNEDGKLINSTTPESLIGDYGRGLSENIEYDNREALFVIAYLFDQILSGLAWSGESAIKAAGLRLLLNGIEKIRLSMTWKTREGEVNIVYGLDDIIHRCEGYTPSWLDQFSVPFSGIGTTKGATVLIDKTVKAELKSTAFKDF